MEKNLLTRIKWKNYINYMGVGLFALVFTLMSLTSGLPSSTLYLLEKIAISIILAVSLSLVVGFLGELSLGHAGFMCIGAYIGGKLASVLEGALGNGVLTLFIAIIVGGVCAAVFGVIIGLPALRLKGDYLAIVTLAFGEIVKTIFRNTSNESFGGTLGLPTPRYDKKTLFIFAFLLVLACLAVTQNIIRSKHGRAITSIRDNEIAARAMGINVTKYKLMVFTVAAFFAGIAGVFYSYSQFNVQSDKFGYNYSIEILVMVVLGGMGSVNGSILAATLITYLNTKLATMLTGEMAILQNLIYSLILVLIVIYNNAPGLKGFREKYNFGAFMDKVIKKKDKNEHQEGDDDAQWARIPTKINMDEIISTDIVAKDNAKSGRANKGEKGDN